MFNLLRMDLYRVKRSKSVYVCFGILVFVTVFGFWLMWLLGSDEGHKISLAMGMLSTEELFESESILAGVDFLGFFSQICLDGGAYNVIFGVWVMLFVCGDFQSGFIKNIMALHQNRWKYIGSKVLTVWIVDFCYLGLHLLSALMLNRIFGNLVPDAMWKDILFYLSWVWFLTTAFGALIIFICVLTRSVAAASLTAVLLGGGVVVMALYGILNLFHAGEWLKYSIYLTCAEGPEKYTSVKNLYVYVVGIGFLILYTVLSGMILRKKDI
ncbi:MAG: ABC transporter permease [Dorea sp.]|jgi:hypothetical protein|nr:ABC transporter permease [Dorea sp.]